MPPLDGVADLVRIVIGQSGRVGFRTELVVRFDYGKTVPWVSRLEDGTIDAIAGPERLVPQTPTKLYGEDLRTIDNYILQGRYEQARRLFDRLLSRCNDVGLLPEEFDPQTGRMLGNFPQAYSHVGLINCALNLSLRQGPAEERAHGCEGQPPINIPTGAYSRH
jgi:Glycosyl hydrolases family 15